MAEVWGAAVGAAVSAGAAGYAANQQRKAGKDAARAAQQAAEISQRQYEQSRLDQLPFIQAGYSALNQLQALNRGDFSSFTESPDYKFARDQGIKALDRSAAARGTQFSGGQLAALAQHAAGLASQNYSNYYNRIAQLAGLGQSAAAGVGNQGMAFAAQAGAALQNAGNALADARIAQGSTYQQLGDRLGQAFGRWYEGLQRQKDPAQ